jgi:hypothetical protein
MKKYTEMKKINTRKAAILLSLFTLFGFHQFYGQTPFNDHTWLLQDGTNSTTDLSDEFNGTSINTTKWHIFDCATDPYCSWGQATGMTPSMTTVSGGYLNLRTDGNVKSPHCDSPDNYPSGYTQYNTGGIQSQGASYSYGYLEMNAQLPGFVDGNGVAHADKLWPAFWTYYDTYDTYGCNTYHDEIDMMDECCSQYQDARSTGAGVNKWTQVHITTPLPNGSCIQTNVTSSNWKLYNHPSILCYNNQATPPTTNYHKYAVEWNVGKTIFYFDDIVVNEVYDNVLTMVSMFLVIDLQIDGSSSFYSGFPFTSSANSSMSLEYLRYYKLKLDCSNSSTILTNTDLSNFFTVTATTPSVKSDIIIGNGTSSVSMGSTDSDFFRAVNTITVKGDFTVPLGATLALLPTACN